MNTILVVEDDPALGQTLQNSLRELGYAAPRLARSGVEALHAVEELRPDLVLMDVELTGPLDGIETAARLHERWDTPVIYVTGHSDDATLRRATQTVPHGFLVKPFLGRDLRVSIEVALHKAELERQLVERERWFSTTLESIGDAVIATNPAGAVTFMNRLAEEYTGWTRKDAYNNPLSDVLRLVDEGGARIPSPVAQAIDGGVRVELQPDAKLLTRAGDAMDIEDCATAIVDQRGTLLGGVVVFRDVREHKRMERRLALSERLASIGKLSAGMAHEINNPLAAVIGNVTFARESLARALQDRPHGADALAIGLEEGLAALTDAIEAADRVRKIISDLKKFSHAERSQNEVLELCSVLDSALKLSEHEVRHSAVVERVYGVTPPIRADELQLVQVFTNLLTNAAQAIGEGNAAANRIRVATFTDASGRAVAEVHDTGCGISKSMLDQVFDPFFSTKAIGEGMGLGLSICHGIVSSAGGEISVESERGTGTTFRVALPPASIPCPPLQQPAQAAAPIISTRGRILVLDDDESVARMVRRLLSDDYDVVTETDSRAALARLANGAVFDSILCDVMMPEMSGIDVYHEVLAAHPDLAKRMIFLTGGSFSARATQFLQSVENPIISKPFDPHDLRAVLAKTCDLARRSA